VDRSLAQQQLHAVTRLGSSARAVAAEADEDPKIAAKATARAFWRLRLAPIPAPTLDCHKFQTRLILPPLSQLGKSEISSAKKQEKSAQSPQAFTTF
jgi:hypothetical protein